MKILNNEKPYTPFGFDEFYQRYYVHRVAVLAVIVKDDKILLTYQFRGREKGWGLPGGLLEKGEPLKIGLVREIFEETNIKILPKGILAVTDWAGESIFDDDPYKHSGMGIIFASEYISGEPKPDGIEVFDVNFIGESKFDELTINTFTRKCFIAYKTNRSLFLNKEKFDSFEKYLYGYGPFLKDDDKD